MRVELSGGYAAAIAALAFTVACDRATPAVPTNPSTPQFTSIEITGPDTLAPGQSAQLTAVAVRRSDGGRETASAASYLRWGFNALFVRVSTDGLATATNQLGDTTVSASVPAFVEGGRINTSKVITIVPEGTFRVVGRVSDAEDPSVAIPGALVEVMPGPLVATTDLAGQYRLYGVPGEATVRITKASYQVVERSLRLTAHATQDFGLPPDGPRALLTGPYTLAIDVGSACVDNNVSAQMRHLRYAAVLTQNGTVVDVALVEPRFRVNSIGRGNRFSGVAYSGGATFTLLGFDFDSPPGPLTYPNVAEQLPDGTVLSLSGTVATVGGQAGLTGQMSGGSFLSRFGATFPTPPSFEGGCNFLSPLVFTLTPR